MLSQTVVHSFHALELKIAMRPVRSGKGREGSIHKMIRPMKNLQKILRYFLLLLLVCQTWPEQDSAEMIQDSPWQCQRIVYFIKDKMLLLIGSNDQTHLIDPNSLSDMNYHDCFDSFVYFLLPPSTIARSTANSIVIVIKKWTSNTCSPAHFFQLQRLMSSPHFADSETLARMLL